MKTQKPTRPKNNLSPAKTAQTPKTDNYHAQIAGKSNKVQQLRTFQEMADNSARVQGIAQLISKAAGNIKARALPNNSGLPLQLKSGIEQLSGQSMDDVKVHFNSSKPAQLQAHAYAQGTDIHLASGQEKHLPHEAWHVVQQKQGRVRATQQLKGQVAINDDPRLEREADEMGARAMQLKRTTPSEVNSGETGFSAVIQRSRNIIQAKHYDSIDKDIEEDDLAEHDWEQYPTEKLSDVHQEIEGDHPAKQKIRGIIQERNDKHAKNAALIAESQPTLAEKKDFAIQLNEERLKLQAEIDRELDIIIQQNHLEEVHGMMSLVNTIKKGRDSWEREAAPYLRELFLGLSELGLGEVQMGTKFNEAGEVSEDGTRHHDLGGDVVYGGGTNRFTTVQSKYFTADSLEATVGDIAKAINQLRGGGGEKAYQGSKKEVDVVIDNVQLESSIGVDDIIDTVNEAVHETAEKAKFVDKILIALPHAGVQYRVNIVNGQAQHPIAIPINPQRFDLPELHKTTGQESIKDLFKRRDKVHVKQRELGEEITKLEQMIISLEQVNQKVHNGKEPEEPMFSGGLFDSDDLF